MTKVQRWDEWFEVVGDSQASREWQAVKEVHTDEANLDWWATIIELNRIDRVTQDKTPAR